MMGSDSDLSSRKVLFLICMVAFLVSAGMRLIEARRWDPVEHRLDDEYLLATHDAYAWVAGAEVTDARSADHIMSRSLSLLSSLTGVASANLAFWLPPALGALAAIPIALWAAHLNAPAGASLAAGLLGSLAPSIYSRTRLGYYDTDWATLFFPLLGSLLIALWLDPYLQDQRQSASTSDILKRVLSWPLFLMLILPIAVQWHGFIRVYLLAMMWLSLALMTLVRRSIPTRQALIELFAVSLTLALGWLGTVAGLVILMGQMRLTSERFDTPNAKWLLLALVLCLLLVLSVFQFQDYLVDRLQHYLGLSVAGKTELPFPELSQSVRETQDIGLKQALDGAAFQWWLGVLAVFGYGYVIIKRPLAVLLAPSLLLGLLSPAIGVRFTMFAAPVMALGLIVPISWVVPERISSSGEQVLHSNWVFLSGTFAILALVFRTYSNLSAQPVLDREHAAALRSLPVAQQGGYVWTWWDYGYAAQYFTGLPTFADGGRNTGPYLYTLSRVLGGDNPEAAARLIAYSAAHGNEPWLVWERWDRADLDAWLENPHTDQRIVALPFPHYLVVQWDAVSFLPWIQHFGSWSFEHEQGLKTTEVTFAQPLELDLENGRFTERAGRQFDLVSADILQNSGPTHYDYPESAGGLHLLLNADRSEVYLLDDQAYRSTLVQLLIQPLNQEAEWGGFRLVVDRLPSARVFKLE